MIASSSSTIDLFFNKTVRNAALNGNIDIVEFLIQRKI